MRPISMFKSSIYIYTNFYSTKKLLRGLYTMAMEKPAPIWRCMSYWKLGYFPLQLPSRKLTYPPDKAYLKMIFLFPRWDMLVPWRVLFLRDPCKLCQQRRITRRITRTSYVTSRAMLGGWESQWCANGWANGGSTDQSKLPVPKKRWFFKGPKKNLYGFFMSVH